ncbi:hypothetical protein H9N25_12945 [Pedobacter riviphilus]|uniref:Uncharacterized protein n=1 Tax=Pedobacter riviphilus TaxID=2766984 RepID=A0ABX6TES6_9SPHI|nr:hypothetical protein [Pedobacter riviphilus]QNR82895.1 hypothetical protein H9N25_12945 [Pedobacter riviphilus]
MLKDELHDIEKLFSTWGNSGNDIIVESTFQSKSQRLFEGWKMMAFSEISDKSLRRYFYYQLEGILKISDTLFNMADIELSKKTTDPLFLLDHLKQYFPNYFNNDAMAPIAYHQRSIEQWSEDVRLLKSKLKKAQISAELKTSVCKWVEELNEINYSRRYSFREISYSKYIIEQMLLIDIFSDKADNNLISFLSSANFNHLAFLVYRQNKIRKELEAFICLDDKINYLHNQKATVASVPEVKHIAYNISWPSLKIMLGDWLQEEILLTEKSLSKRSEVAIPKIPLELSVAHLSCLIRLLFEESVFATQNLQFIFKGFAGHYQSKRQAVISPGSLSKEFYSIDQHTAARVRDLLQRMVLRINRNFFPMAVAINATVLSYLNMR